MSLFDKLKQKAEELGLPEKAGQLQEAAGKAAHQAKEKAAELADQNRDKVAGALDKATHVIDEKTDGKYHDKVAKATGAVAKGVDKLAEQGKAAGHPAAAAAAGAGEPTTPDVPAPDKPVDDAGGTDEWEPPSSIPPANPLRSEAGDDLVEHRLGELAGEGVLLAHVVAAERAAPRRPPAVVSTASAPWPNRGLGRGTSQPAAGAPPRARRPRRSTRARASTAGAARRARGRGRASGRTSPSPAWSACSRAARTGRRRRSAARSAPARRRSRHDVGWLAYPARCSAAYSQSPERSPVNIRPVRLVPLAAGARPTMSTRASGSPNDGPGPAPVGLVGERRPPPGHGDRLAPLDEPRAGAADRDPRVELGDVSAPRRRAGARPRAVSCHRRRGVAGSPGQPVPGGTGDAKSSPVTGCGSRVLTGPTMPYAAGHLPGAA